MDIRTILADIFCPEVLHSPCAPSQDRMLFDCGDSDRRRDTDLDNSDLRNFSGKFDFSNYINDRIYGLRIVC